MIGTLLTFMMDVFMRTNYFKQFVKEKNVDWENYIFSRKN